MAIRYLSAVLGRQPLWTGVVISIVAFYFALVYFLRLARSELGDEEQAVTAVMLLAAYPFAVFFSAAYTESLFLLTLLGAVYHFRQNQLWRSAFWGFVCGLTRPPGCFLSIVLGLMAVAPMWDAARWRVIVAAANRVAQHRQAPARRVGARARHADVLCVRVSADRQRVPVDDAEPGVGHGCIEAWIRLCRTASTFITNNGLYNYASTQTIDLFYSLAVLLALVAVVPVYRRFGLPYAVFIILNVLPPMSAGGMLSMGRVTSIVFPVFLWLGAAVPARHRMRVDYGSSPCSRASSP